jgi:hypothetical protein
MMKNILFLFVALCLASASGMAQKPKPKAQPKVIFAVLDDGKTIEPIARVEAGKLVAGLSNDDDAAVKTNFQKTYYKPKTIYSLIFGGNMLGNVSVVKNDPQAECMANMANVTTTSTKAKLKGFVMGLATDIKLSKPAAGLRRLPTAAERAEIEKLVATEFVRNNVKYKKLNYHNLTALDPDNDKLVDFVGSYWVTTSPTERAMIFFIAGKPVDGKYGFTYSEVRTVKQDEVMSGDIKDVDSGVYHELLLDVLDFDGDGRSEIFTTSQSFEGRGFNVYQRAEGAYEKILEVSNYHCAY